MKNNDRMKNTNPMVQNADVTSYPPIMIDDDVIHIDNLAEYNTNAVQTNGFVWQENSDFGFIFVFAYMICSPQKPSFMFVNLGYF